MPFKAGSVLQKGAGTHKKAKNRPFRLFLRRLEPPPACHTPDTTTTNLDRGFAQFLSVLHLQTQPQTRQVAGVLVFALLLMNFEKFHEVAARQACPQPPGRSGATSGSTEHAKTTQYRDSCRSKCARSSKKAWGCIKRPRTTHLFISSCFCVVWSSPQHFTHLTRPKPV